LFINSLISVTISTAEKLYRPQNSGDITYQAYKYRMSDNFNDDENIADYKTPSASELRSIMLFEM